MPNYGMPGVSTNRRQSLLAGLAALAVIVALVGGFATFQRLRPTSAGP